MNPWRSIRVRLSGVFLLFLLLILLQGAFAIFELHTVNSVSAEVRDRWLQSVRVLGDLNNDTSDMRAAEASRLLARDPGRRDAVERDIATLERAVAKDQRAYAAIPHDGVELGYYERFDADWRAYLVAADQVLGAARQGRAAEGAQLYMTRSLNTYNAASDALGVLTDRTVARAGRANDRAEATYQTAGALITAMILLAGLCLVLAVNYITHFLSNPLLALAARMRQLAANDTHGEIDGLERRDEIGEMARSVVVFRNNAIELALSQRGLMQQASMLEERLEAERTLTQLQRNFVSMASHEFRTPLTIIDGHAQRLAKTRSELAPADVVDRAGRIRAAVQRMTHVIERLLNSARLFEGEAGLYFHPTSFAPETLLCEVCREHREISPGARIIETLRGLPPSMTGDPKLLHQAFSNLLSNAIKFSPDNTPVQVTAACDTGASVLSVSIEDAGLGIPSDDLARVFDRYHRGANVSGVVGTGVGLYLVKMVVDLHGGDVSVHSAEGVGTRFVVSLPLAVDDRRQARPTEATLQP